MESCAAFAAMAAATRRPPGNKPAAPIRLVWVKNLRRDGANKDITPPVGTIVGPPAGEVNGFSGRFPVACFSGRLRLRAVDLLPGQRILQLAQPERNERREYGGQTSLNAGA